MECGAVRIEMVRAIEAQSLGFTVQEEVLQLEGHRTVNSYGANDL